uniref:Ycf1 n=1 Tax=Acrolejeunea sandvicensis TaxID=1755700 RepID=A0A8F3BDM0_9MARC|nr:Ycf1 [Acrolejeunea sandvicensis]
MISISHAYILRRLWEIKTNNKSCLGYLSKSWTSYLFLKTNFKIFLHEQGIVGYINLVKFQEKNWKLWLKNFNRYNLSPKVWDGIAPEKWRFKVSEHWKIKQELVFSNNENKKFMTCWQDSIPKATHLSTRIEKRNKLFKNNFLTYSYFDLNKNTLTKKVLKSKEEQNLYNFSNRISLISDKKKSDSIIEKKIFFEYNLLLWFIPEFIEQRETTYKYKKKILNVDTSIKLKNKILRNKELLQETEFNQSIRQWRWKSKNSEKQFRKLGNMASLMTFMQNQDTKISLSEKMREDLDLFRLFFRRNNIFNQLTINSEHRLPRLLDDQILIYKLISTSSNFRKRFEKMSNLAPIHKYLLNTNVYTNYQIKNLSSVNILSLEDILLPRHRREFRILNSLSLQTEKNINSNKNFLKKTRKQPNKKIQVNKRKKIKRFIWSSYRFEDLACMNRFWFSTLNGSRFCMLRFRIYPII